VLGSRWIIGACKTRMSSSGSLSHTVTIPLVTVIVRRVRVRVLLVLAWGQVGQGMARVRVQLSIIQPVLVFLFPELSFKLLDALPLNDILCSRVSRQADFQVALHLVHRWKFQFVQEVFADFVASLLHLVSSQGYLLLDL